MPVSSTSFHLSSQINRKSSETSCGLSCRKIMRPQEEHKKLSNGALAKRERGVRYRECRKNHAANIGGYAVDGCREFMASGEEGTSALKCAACSCHRNFHRREAEADGPCDCSSDSTSRKSN